VKINTDNVKELVETERYYDEARGFYDLTYHAPISARTYFVIVIALGIIVFWVSLNSFMSIFPLNPKIPFVMSSQDVYDELPVMEKLAKGNETKNEAVMRFLIRNYVERREYYNFFQPAEIEKNFYNIRFHSIREVLMEYRNFLDTGNASSPYNIYGRDTSRTVKITSMKIDRSSSTFQAYIEFTETLSGSKKSISPEWIAEMSFTYTPFEVKQDLEDISLTNFFSVAREVYNNPGKYSRESKFAIKPMTFTVSSYTTKPKLVGQ
jgi:type IV secretory pathway component VirB8